MLFVPSGLCGIWCCKWQGLKAIVNKLLHIWLIWRFPFALSHFLQIEWHEPCLYLLSLQFQFARKIMFSVSALFNFYALHPALLPFSFKHFCRMASDSPNLYWVVPSSLQNILLSCFVKLTARLDYLAILVPAVLNSSLRHITVFFWSNLWSYRSNHIIRSGKQEYILTFFLSCKILF